MKKLVIAFAVAATAAAAFAAPHARTAHRGGAHMEKFAQKLNLTDAQKQQIRDIHQADRDRNKQIYADYRAKLRQFRELKRAGDPTADAVKAELQPMREQVKAARKATHEAVLNVLTAEQRQQLEQLRAEHPRKRG
ncbi:MAG: Spy/CpxP family protein refolding chaperone [Acidobacteriota bacterium]